MNPNIERYKQLKDIAEKRAAARDSNMSTLGVPSSEGPRNLQRIIRSYESLISKYQREHELNLSTFEYLERVLAAMPNSEGQERISAAIRSNVRRMLRKIAGARTAMSIGGQKGRAIRKVIETEKLRLRNQQFISYAMKCRQAHSRKDFLQLPRVVKWKRKYKIGDQTVKNIIAGVYPTQARRSRAVKADSGD